MKPVLQSPLKYVNCLIHLISIFKQLVEKHSLWKQFLMSFHQRPQMFFLPILCLNSINHHEKICNFSSSSNSCSHYFYCIYWYNDVLVYLPKNFKQWLRPLFITVAEKTQPSIESCAQGNEEYTKCCKETPVPCLTCKNTFIWDILVLVHQLMQTSSIFTISLDELGIASIFTEPIPSVQYNPCQELPLSQK